MDLRFYVRILLRRLHYILLFVVLGTAAGVAVAVLLPPVYRAEARLVVETEQIPGNLAASTVQVDTTEQIEIIRQRILTRETLLEMANRLQVYGPEGAAAEQMAADEVVQDMRQRITILTSGGQRTARAPATPTLVSVSFEAPTPRLAAAVTNEVVTLILDENVAMRTRVAGQTLDFFEQEVARLDGELAQQGSAIQSFQEANRDSLPDSLEFRRGQLVSMQQRLLQVNSDLAVLRDRRQRLVASFEATGSAPVSPTTPRTNEEVQLEALRGQLSSSLALLSPTNPRVRLLQSQITALEAVVAQQAAATAGVQPDSGMSPYDLQLADIDAQVDSLQAEVDRLEGSMAELQASIEATPGNAIRLDSLRRDYDALQAQYNQAVQNRARAETGEQIEVLSRGQRISIIEQAVPPRAPQSPNRPLIAGAGFGGGLVLGLGLVVLIEVLNRSIRRPVEITRALGITPFGALPLIRSRREIRRRRLTIAAAFLIAVIGIPGALWLVHTRLTPLDALIDQAVARVSTLMT